MTSITIPESVTSIGDSAFTSCTSLTAIVIPDSVTEVGAGIFYRCSKLQLVTLSNQITELPSFDRIGFFERCSSLSEIIIPDSVTCIGCNAFSGTALLENQIGVKYADTWVVGCDEDVTVVNIKAGTRGIGDGAFSNCTALATITLPDTITNIGNSAFQSSDNLTDVYYAGSEAAWNTLVWMTGFNNEPFLDANVYCNLTYRILADGTAEVVSCAKDAVQGTIPEKAYGVPVTSIGERAFEGCSSLTSITIPDSVTSIGTDAFLDCSGLTSISIGAGITSLDEIPCDGELLEKIHVSPYHAVYADDNDVLYNKDFTELIRCPKKKAGEIIIPDTVTSIGEGALEDCSSLTGITIPNSLTRIERNTFRGCSRLTSITIPYSVTSIGTDALKACDALTDVYYGGTKDEWETVSISETGNEVLLYATIHFADGTVQKNMICGDIDGNQEIDTMDAYYILLEYAKVSAGYPAEMTEAQRMAADVNHDGKVDTMDAYYVLLYYAMKSVGMETNWETLVGSV